MKEYEVEIIRRVEQHMVIREWGNNRQEATAKALADAPNKDFSGKEKDALYFANGVREL